MTNWRVPVAFSVCIAFSMGFPSAAADNLQPAPSVYAMSSGRLMASAAGLMGLIGIVVGGLALRSAGHVGAGSGRRGAIVALVLGLVGIALGTLVVSTAGGGVGTGNGLGGGIVAIVMGLMAMVLGGLALARFRRKAGQLYPIPSPPPPAE